MTTKLSTALLNVAAAVKSFLDGADQAAMRTALGLSGSTEIESVLKNGPTDTVAANALTVVSQAYSLAFRSTTLGSAASALVTGTPAALVVPSGATLGTVSGQQSDIAVAVMNNGGTLEYAVANVSGGLDMSETGLMSTTAISAAATSAAVWYSATGRSNLPYRLVRVIRSTQAAAGAWATAPSLVQGVGGLAFAAMQSLGVGQTWQTVARTGGTTYYNTTGKPIFLSVMQGAFTSLTITVNGVQVAFFSTASAAQGSCYAIIPPGASYVISNTTSCTIAELR